MESKNLNNLIFFRANKYANVDILNINALFPNYRNWRFISVIYIKKKSDRGETQIEYCVKLSKCEIKK